MASSSSASGGALQPAAVHEVKLTPSPRAAPKPSRRDPFAPVTKSQLCELVCRKANIRENRLHRVGKILSFIAKIAKVQLQDVPNEALDLIVVHPRAGQRQPG